VATYIPAAIAAFIALILALTLAIGPVLLILRVRAKRRRAQGEEDALSPEGRARLEQF
jgi:hypothetical protein